MGVLFNKEDEKAQEEIKKKISTIRQEASAQAILRDFSSFTGEAENDEELKELTEKAKEKYAKAFGKTVTE
jgi:hypothetical protein